MAHLKSSFAPSSGPQLDQCEAQLGVVLPTTYRAFLLSHNGGAPDPNMLLVPACGNVLVDFLYGVAEEPQACELLHEQELVRSFEQLPPGWIKIGHDPGGNSFLLCTVGDYSGQVFYWDSAEFFEASSSEGNTYLVADTIQDMLSKLKPVE